MYHGYTHNDYMDHGYMHHGYLHHRWLGNGYDRILKMQKYSQVMFGQVQIESHCANGPG